MQHSAMPRIQEHLGRMMETWYNGRAGQSITFDPVSNPYAAAAARTANRRATSMDAIFDLAQRRALRSEGHASQLRAA
jgi:hypothetical protein